MINSNDVSEILRVLRREHIPFEPEKLRDQVANFLVQYRQLAQPERITIRNQFGPQYGGKLLRCAEELAVRAIRNNAVDDVALGLLAVALEGVQSDFRTTVTGLCLLHHSAVKLGVDPVPLFQHAADFGTAKARDFILEYLRIGEKDIRAFRRVESQGPDGFHYEVVAA